MGDLAIFDLLGAEWIPHWLRVVIILVLIVAPALVSLIAKVRDLRNKRIESKQREESIKDAVDDSDDTQALIVELLKSIQMRLNTMYFTLHNTGKTVQEISASLDQDNEATVAAFETIYDEIVEVNESIEQLSKEVSSLKSKNGE